MIGGGIRPDERPRARPQYLDGPAQGIGISAEEALRLYGQASHGRDLRVAFGCGDGQGRGLPCQVVVAAAYPDARGRDEPYRLPAPLVADHVYGEDDLADGGDSTRRPHLFG